MGSGSKKKALCRHHMWSHNEVFLNNTYFAHKEHQKYTFSDIRGQESIISNQKVHSAQRNQTIQEYNWLQFSAEMEYVIYGGQEDGKRESLEIIEK